MRVLLRRAALKNQEVMTENDASHNNDGTDSIKDLNDNESVSDLMLIKSKDDMEETAKDISEMQVDEDKWGNDSSDEDDYI